MVTLQITGVDLLISIAAYPCQTEREPMEDDWQFHSVDLIMNVVSQNDTYDLYPICTKN